MVENSVRPRRWAAPVSEVHEDDVPESYRTVDQWPAHAPGDEAFEVSSGDFPVGDGFTLRPVDLNALKAFRRWVVMKWKESEGDDQRHLASVLSLVDVFCKEAGL